MPRNETECNKNMVLQFERHKPNPNPNIIIITNVTAVTSAKHSDSDTEPTYFVRLSNLRITWMIKTSQAAQYCIELLNKLYRFNVRAVSVVSILRRISSQCRQQTDNTTSLVCFAIISASAITSTSWPHSNRTVFATTGIILFVAMSSCTVQIVGNYLISYSRIIDVKHRSCWYSVVLWNSLYRAR
jgi:hypothetical protein